MIHCVNHPGIVLNEYIRQTGYSINEFSKLLDIPTIKLKRICEGLEDIDSSIISKLSIITPFTYRDWYDICLEYKIFKCTQIIVGKLPKRIQKPVNKLLGY